MVLRNSNWKGFALLLAFGCGGVADAWARGAYSTIGDADELEVESIGGQAAGFASDWALLKTLESDQAKREEVIKAAESGTAAAMHTLACMNFHGKGVAQNYTEAYRLTRLAAFKGVAPAQNNLGYMSAEGKGTKKDEVEALKWYRTAANFGNTYAQCNLGYMFETGRGVPQNLLEAEKWYSAAAQQGLAIAKRNLYLVQYEISQSPPAPAATAGQSQPAGGAARAQLAAAAKNAATPTGKAPAAAVASVKVAASLPVKPSTVVVKVQKGPTPEEMAAAEAAKKAAEAADAPKLLAGSPKLSEIFGRLRQGTSLDPDRNSTGSSGAAASTIASSSGASSAATEVATAAPAASPTAAPASTSVADATTEKAPKAAKSKTSTHSKVTEAPASRAEMAEKSPPAKGDSAEKLVPTPKVDVAEKPVAKPAVDVAEKPAATPKATPAATAKVEIAEKPAAAPEAAMAEKAVAPKVDVVRKPVTTSKTEVAAKPGETNKFPDAANKIAMITHGDTTPPTIQKLQPVSGPTVQFPIRDKWALVIGISKFQRKGIPGLKFASKDATDFYRYLVNEANFAPDHVRLLLDEKATQRRVMSELGSKFLARVAKPQDLVVIFVSTHGSPSQMDLRGKSYVVAHDSDPDDLFATGIEMQKILESIQGRVLTDRVLLVMDACHSGFAAPNSKGLYRMANFDAEELAQGSGQMVVCSSSPNERSWESTRYANSVFTRKLLDGLRSHGEKTSLTEAFTRASAEVAQEVQEDRAGARQTPILKGKWSGNDLLVGLHAASPQAVPSSVKAELEPDSAVSLTISQPGTAGAAAQSAALDEKPVHIASSSASGSTPSGLNSGSTYSASKRISKEPPSTDRGAAQTPLFLNASYFALTGDSKALHKEYSSAIKASGKNPELYYMRARALMGLKDWFNAMLDLGDALQLYPNKSSYYLARAYALHKLGKQVQAQEDLNQAKFCDNSLPRQIEFSD